MGGHHAACGAAVWIALTNSATVEIPLAQAGTWTLPLGFGILDVGPIGVVAGALMCAGAALLPDADHPNATIAHSLPPVSTAIVSGVGKVSGGHRHGTHSILGIVAAVILAWAAQFLTPANVLSWIGQPTTDTWWANLQVGPALMSMILVGFALTTLKFVPVDSKRLSWMLAGATALILTFTAPQAPGWFPLVIGVGVTVHILGDMLTVGGCNLLWPAVLRPPQILAKLPVINWMWKPNGYLAVPLLGKAGSWREWLLLVPISVYAIWGIGTAAFAGLQAWLPVPT